MTAESSSLLFVYGTLIPGLEPAGMSDVVRRLKVISPATIHGRLYDLGAYPGIRLDPEGPPIKGHLLHVPTQDLWRALDAYEGCPLPGSEDGLFGRVYTTARLPSGESLQCWVYVYNRDLAGASCVECGCWLTHRRLSKMQG